MKLTARQRKFCEALAADPERNQTRAAIAAGYPPEAASARGAENVSKRSVQEYLAELTGKAIERAEKRAVVSAERALEILSAQAEGDVAAKVMRRSGSKPLRVYEPMKAAGMILDYYAKANEQSKGTTVYVNIEKLLAIASPGALKEVNRRALTETNGNGH